MKKPLQSLLLLFLILNQSCSSNPEEQSIKLNQLGYCPQGPKIAIVADTDAIQFSVINEDDHVVFDGNLEAVGYWDKSGETLKQADFSQFNAHGTFRLKVEDAVSFPFEIGTDIYDKATIASLKSFYFHRSGVDLPEAYAGNFARKRDHMYDSLLFHSSSGKPENTAPVSSIGGWYDAGDYGKYIVNAAVSVSTMLHLYELHPNVFPDHSLNIPESGNQISDLLDELKFEIEWMRTMQDEDGGVFHKTTAKGFEGMHMPDEVDDQRYIIGKSTNASVTFAGTLAQAAVIFKEIDPPYATELKTAAVRAWNWAQEHPDALYLKNPNGIRTGSYNSDDLSGESFWAAVELLRATGEKTYQNYLTQHSVPLKHQLEESWRTYYPYLAYYTLAHQPSLAPNLDSKTQLVQMAEQQYAKLISNPYRISIDHFVWGSNSDILNQAMLFQMAHSITKTRKFFDASIEMVDYLFGKNAVATSFLTGFGEQSTQRPHHRLAESDAVDGPIPGFVAGGPNHDRQDTHALLANGKKYANDYPAKCYIDELPSFASNEVCINWNAPAVFALGYIEANKELLR